MDTNQLDNSWRTASLFISSTFIDMNEERDVLINYVLPKLNEQFNSKRISVQLVDLRWGIRTTEIKEESERDNKVLSVCFDEIDRCHPFFIAILGDRYGYDQLDYNIIKENSFRFKDVNADLYEKSVTELEILYGTLKHPEKQLANSLFCFRKADYSGMSRVQKHLYTKGVLKLNLLKQKIIDNCEKYDCLQNIIYYETAEWNNRKHRFDSFDKKGFGDLLFSKLACIISDNMITLDESTAMTYPEKLKFEQDSFLNKEIVAIGMKKRIMHLLEFPQKLIIIQGEHGVGKSALLKKLALHLQSKNNVQHILYYNAGLSARCRDIKNMVLCWIYQINNTYDQSLDSISVCGIKDYFENILQKYVDEGHEFVFIIDSYDLLYKNPISESLSFLRFASKSFVATQKDSKVYFHRDTDEQTIFLNGLDLDEAKKMMMVRFEHLHKECPPILWDSIQKKFKQTINPLWIELAVSILSRLSTDDYKKIQIKYSNGNNGSEATEKYLLSLVDEFPTSVGALFGYLFNKAFSDQDWTFSQQYLLWLIALSRNGIRESDLAAMTKNDDWDTLMFAQVRYYFDSCLQETLIDNCWGFNHIIYNKVLENHIIRTGQNMNIDFLQMLHGALGHHYIHCSDEYDLRISECMYHLIHGNDKQTSAGLLLNSNVIGGDDYNNNVREVVDFIIQNNESKRRYYQAPKEVPIPDIMFIHNDSVGWLMELLHLNFEPNKFFIERLISIFATDVTKGINNRGDVSSCFILNLKLLVEITEMKGLISDDDWIILYKLVEHNCQTAGNLLGISDLQNITKRNSDNHINNQDDETDTTNGLSEMQSTVLFVNDIEEAKHFAFLGNFNKSICLCEDLLRSMDRYRDKINIDLFEEGAIKVKMCLADSYERIGDFQKAKDIYTELENEVEQNSERWFLLQERLFNVYRITSDLKCLDIAKKYLSKAEKVFNENRTTYGNCEVLLQALILYADALIICNRNDSNIEVVLNRAERLLMQLLDEYHDNKQMMRFYISILKYKSVFYLDNNKTESVEELLKRRLELSEILCRRDVQDFDSSIDYANASEDLGDYYAQNNEPQKAHELFTEVIRIINEWQDTDNKQNRLAISYLKNLRMLISLKKSHIQEFINEYRTNIIGFSLIHKEMKKSYLNELDLICSKAE